MPVWMALDARLVDAEEVIKTKTARQGLSDAVELLRKYTSRPEMDVIHSTVTGRFSSSESPRKPDIRLDLYFSEVGYQADLQNSHGNWMTECRDFRKSRARVASRLRAFQLIQELLKELRKD